jgi:hypothetical protein
MRDLHHNPPKIFTHYEAFRAGVRLSDWAEKMRTTNPDLEGQRSIIWTPKFLPA